MPAKPSDPRQPGLFPADRTRLLVTGATGYVGRRLIQRADRQAIQVVAAVRDPARYSPPGPGVEVGRFDLTSPAPADDLLDRVDAVIHLAAIIPDESIPDGEDPNVGGSRRLIEAARAAGVRRFVFLSSQSAAADSPTSYGRGKWRIESLLDGDGEIAVRTGLVCGGPPRGLYGRLLRMLRRVPLLPVIRAGAPVYPLHVDDLCDGLLALATGRAAAPRIVRLAGPEALPFGDFLRSLAATRLGRRVRILPVPVWMALAALRLSEWLPFGPHLPRERVLGLIALKPMDPDPATDPPEAASLRPLPQALAAEGRRHLLLGEGLTLATYALGTRPPGGVARRYARALVAAGQTRPLQLPDPLRRFPRLLALVEPVGPSALGKRLALATRIVEMTPQAAPRFHSYRERSAASTLLALAWLLAVEALLFPARIVAAFLFRIR